MADWESVALNGCTIYLAFDSDAMLKESVYIALMRLKRFLESRKAIVKIIYLPQPAEDSTATKTGIDDYIAQQLSAGKTPSKFVMRYSQWRSMSCGHHRFRALIPVISARQSRFVRDTIPRSWIV